MMMLRSKTQILHQHARRILASSSRSFLFRRSYSTLRSQIKPDLEEWVKQGNDQVKPSYVRNLIKNLHDTKQSSQALEASEWMCQQRVFTVFPEDYAARLHLVETVLGMEEAEKFFKSIPENMRDYSVYNTLLGSYTRSEETLNKAESTFEKMRDLGFLLKPNPYNSMISLYEQLKKQDMVEKLQRELKEKGVKKMEKSITMSVDEKGKKPEEGEELINLYTRELDGLWDEYMKKGKVKDGECRSVISSLLKLNNVQEAEKKYGEWYPNGPEMDMSIPDLLISRFCAEGNGSKVEEMVKSVRKKRIVMQLKMAVLRLGYLIGIIALVGITLIAGAIMLAILAAMVTLAVKVALKVVALALKVGVSLGKLISLYVIAIFEQPIIFSSIIFLPICLSLFFIFG